MSTASLATTNQEPSASIQLNLSYPLPLWLHAARSKHIVKGNFMALCVRPKAVEPGEWVAHQVVEHYRNLWNFVRLLLDKDVHGNTICNSSTCPTMSAGEKQYTWLNKNSEPVNLPGNEYMTMMQHWISTKIDDSLLFPTDPDGASWASDMGFDIASQRPPPLETWLGATSGFPQQYDNTCRIMFRQMFRIYAHLYWNHFVEPFYHLNLEKQLNSCFCHFILTATTLEMLERADLEPMQHLIDLWAADGTLPRESKIFTYANMEVGKYILALGIGNQI